MSGRSRSPDRAVTYAGTVHVDQRYTKTSIVLTTNRGVGAWGEILGDTTVAAAMLDRLLHRSVVLNLDGDSYRLRDHHARTDTFRRATTGNTRQPLLTTGHQVGNFDEHPRGTSASAIITGNLTTAPELQYLPTGRPVARFTVAVNSRRRTEAGEWVDGETTYFPVTVWAEQAEHVAESLIKGSRVVVLGTIKFRSWTPAEGERAGQTLTRLEVTADVVAASLQWATATLVKAPRSEQSPTADERDAEQAPF